MKRIFQIRNRLDGNAVSAAETLYLIFYPHIPQKRDFFRMTFILIEKRFHPGRIAFHFPWTDTSDCQLFFRPQKFPAGGRVLIEHAQIENKTGVRLSQDFGKLIKRCFRIKVDSEKLEEGSGRIGGKPPDLPAWIQFQISGL